MMAGFVADLSYTARRTASFSREPARSFGTGWSTGASVDEAVLRARLELRHEHRDLDAAIAALADLGSPDQLQLARLKKRKLKLRDEMAAIEDQIVPDIIA